MKVVLRMLSDDSEGDKYRYLQEVAATCDIVTPFIGAAKIFDFKDVKNGIVTHTSDWKITPLGRELKRIFKKTDYDTKRKG